VRAIELSTLGWSQLQIAGDLGVSQAAVSKILKRAETRMLREWAETVDRHKAKQSLRLEHLFAEAIRAWHDSKADTTRRRQRKTESGQGGISVAEIVVENQHGDPRYLDEARKALADQRKLWGLDAPQKVDLRASQNPYDDMTEEALRAELARQAQLLGVTEPPVIEITRTDGQLEASTVKPESTNSREQENADVDEK
jgi:hypothetical protein